MKSTKNLIAIMIFLFILSCSASKIINLNKDNIQLVNRDYNAEESIAPDIVAMNSNDSDGLAILKNTDFSNGIIELDIKGENNPGRSFVGMAFNIQNDSTYEAIYFRPFNFHSPEKIRREHSMQYIFHPDFSWRMLRSEKEGQFEAEFFNPPSPDDWFSVKIFINPKNVKVEDQRSGKLLIQVDRLAKQTSNKIGFWTGFGSKGSFRNLKVKKS